MSVICPLVCMMTMASVRPDNGVNAASAATAGTEENEIVTTVDKLFFYEAKSVIKASPSFTYSPVISTGKSGTVDDRTLIFLSLDAWRRSAAYPRSDIRFGGTNYFLYPPTARHKKYKVSAYNFRAHLPRISGDIIAERITAYVDYYPYDRGKTKVRFELTRLHGGDLTEYKKWQRDAARQEYQSNTYLQKSWDIDKARTWKGLLKEMDRRSQVNKKVEHMSQE